MSQPVWTLSVDLQTKTATFQSGMSDAARAARGSFNDIKSGAGDMARDVGTNMGEARHGVMLLGEEFGIHLPRALTTFIAGLGPIGAAMEAAFPFLAIVVGATLLIEHLAKVREEGEKLTEAQAHFGVVAANVLNDLDDKLLQAGIRTDELNGNHLDALEKQLQLIDHQSLKELEHSFEELAKASDATMAQLKTSWYQFGSGSEGAKHALDEFKQKYELLLATGKDKEASDLLAGTLKSAEHILALQNQIKDQQAHPEKSGNEFEQQKFHVALNELKAAGTGMTEKEVEAQQTLVDALRAQVSAEQKVHDLKNLQDSNARQSTQKSIDSDDDRVFREQMREKQRAQEEADKEDEQRYKEAVSRIQEAERAKIEATNQGSQARLNAIDAAIKEENAKGLQETEFYKSLLRDRVNAQREFEQEQSKLAAEAGKEQSEHRKNMGLLDVAADREKQAVALETKKKGNQEIIASDLELAEREFQIKKQSFEDDIAALDRNANDYNNKLKALQDREAELVKAHENEIVKIKDDAAKKSEKDEQQSFNRLRDITASGLSDVLLRHRSFASMIGSIGDEVANGMLQNAIKSVMALDFGKEKEAAAAARKMFIAGTKFPFPANLIMPEVLGAAAFASVMAFESGGIVPGVENADIVNAKLMPGETVLPKNITEKLNRATDDSGNSQRPTHVHHHAHHYHINAIDGASVKGMLDKHSDQFDKHVENRLRRLNR